MMSGMMFNAVLAQAARAGSGGGDWSGLVLTLMLVVIALALLMGFARRYKRCPSNKILVIYGKTGSGVARCIHGGAPRRYRSCRRSRRMSF